MNRPRKTRMDPDVFNPLRLLTAAVLVQALSDDLYPNGHVPKQEQYQASQFLHDPEIRALLTDVYDIPEKKVID